MRRQSTILMWALPAIITRGLAIPRITDAFFRFSMFLMRKLRDIPNVQGPNAIKQIMEEIDFEVRGLEIECRKLGKLRAMEEKRLEFFKTLLTVSSPGANRYGISVSNDAAAILREYVELQGEVNELELRKSVFYVPYVLRKLSQ